MAKGAVSHQIPDEVDRVNQEVRREGQVVINPWGQVHKRIPCPESHSWRRILDRLCWDRIKYSNHAGVVCRVNPFHVLSAQSVITYLSNLTGTCMYVVEFMCAIWTAMILDRAGAPSPAV